MAALVAEYKTLDERTLYVRRFKKSDVKRFFDLMQLFIEQSKQPSKEWVIAFGLCDDQNRPTFLNDKKDLQEQLADIDAAAADMDLFIDDANALESLIYARMGIQLDRLEKKA